MTPAIDAIAGVYGKRMGRARKREPSPFANSTSDRSER